MAYLNELMEGKLIVWKTEITFIDKPRQSPKFSLSGLKWYLEFNYQKGQRFHVLSLHRAADGVQLKAAFNTRTFILNTMSDSDDELRVQTAMVCGASDTTLWNSGSSNDHIFNSFPSLFRSSEINFAIHFFGLPPSEFKLEIQPDPSTTSGTASLVGSDGPSDLECLSHDLGSLLECEQWPDVRLNCGGQLFPTHRSVLAARSEVFAAMFRSQMSESETGSVDVKDFQPDVVRQFLQYVYSGKISAESGEAVASLFAMADKYAVESLKRACTRWIVGNLTEGNCVEYLTVADLHGSQALKQEIVAFMCTHPAVMLGGEWTEFSEKNSKLAIEVLQSFVRSKTEA